MKKCHYFLSTLPVFIEGVCYRCISQTNMQRTLPVVLMLFVFLVPVKGQTVRTFLNPGVKIGYDFGIDGGFVMGVECSYTQLSIDEHTVSTGVTVAVDWHRELVKYHCGVQYFTDGLGIEWGPSYLRTEERYGFTSSATLYAWFIALPYVSVTFKGPVDPFMEFGSYFKVPVQLTGPDFKQ